MGGGGFFFRGGGALLECATFYTVASVNLYQSVKSFRGTSTGMTRLHLKKKGTTRAVYSVNPISVSYYTHCLNICQSLEKCA